jgi:hypothetical protein
MEAPEDATPENATPSRVAVAPSHVNKSEEDPVFQIIWRVDAPHLANASSHRAKNPMTKNARMVTDTDPKRPNEQRGIRVECLFVS